MKIQIDKIIIHNREFAVFSIPIKNGGVAYMKQSLAPTISESYVVIADRMRFESVWFKGGDKTVPELARGTVSTWKNDYKYSKADEGFSIGLCNPVPLAQMKANALYPRVAFTNGITRTIWLLANGA